MQDTVFAVGDTVKIKPELAPGFTAPLSKYAREGRSAQITHLRDNGCVLAEFEWRGAKARKPLIPSMTQLRVVDLVLVKRAGE